MVSLCNVPEIFGCDVFNEYTMRQRLPGKVFQTWKDCVTTGAPLPLDSANPIAQAMKDWAMEKGATHYTHWFQPMTGITAGKHDAFLAPTGDGRVIMAFSGRELVRGEPDASSFPNGGLRATFEARGYTAWDPSACAFILDGSLYIPSCFFSYNGEALDKKTPLLRSMEAVSRQALRILRLFGDTRTKRVVSCVGAEQEYFLLPRDLYARREDLRLTGRTLFGAPPPKGQELEDHYFGTIRTRVSEFMKDLDEQLWRLGVLSKTKHNEAAPCQHEMAPIFTDANTACDDNQLVMSVMKKCAARHDLVCLLHEKPFAGVGGSGKHNNWSLATDTGDNLFAPGSTPRQNARFLLFLAAFIAGVDEYPDFLRCTVATAGNDHRLGANEAPPAILSVYLGDELSGVVQSIIQGTGYQDPTRGTLRIGVDTMPPIPRDTTDRNRTSPLAFTGNKFEFRMPGASQSVSGSTIALNTIFAEMLCRFADTLESAPDFDGALQDLIRNTLTQHSRILFDGNCYSSQWKQEAARRGLHELPTTADALPSYISPKNIDLVTRHSVFTRTEFLARYAIHLDAYRKTLVIEARTMLDMATRQILPGALKYSRELCDTVQAKTARNLPHTAESSLLSRLSAHTEALSQAIDTLAEKLSAVPGDSLAAAVYCRSTILPGMEAIRIPADALETLTRKADWPFPTYVDLLYY